jgi:hypothetical protein
MRVSHAFLASTLAWLLCCSSMYFVGIVT